MKMENINIRSVTLNSYSINYDRKKMIYHAKLCLFPLRDSTRIRVAEVSSRKTGKERNALDSPDA